MEGHLVRLPQAVVVAVGAAVAATTALRPRSGLIIPTPVEATGYFSASELDRARDYRRPQRLLGLAQIGVSSGVLATLVLRPPKRVRAALKRAEGSPVVGGVAAGAALSVLLEAVAIPFGAAAERRARRAGLSTQDWSSWGADLAKSSAIGALLAGAGGALFSLLVRRLPRGWWAAGSIAGVALSALSALVAPVLIDPLFNRFTALEPGGLRSEVLDLAARAGVDVGEVYRIDASRRTSAVNAYVNGLGRTKRVVLYDTLLDDFSEAEVRSVVAHELAHVRYRDVQRSILWLALVAPATALMVERLSERLLAGGAARRGPAAIPAVALAASIAAIPLGPAAGALSRAVEARADAFALDLTADVDAFISLERRLALRNIADPDPPRLLHRLLGSHPRTVERIGYALSWQGGRADT
ncbi:MAG: M48 family metallopeptidase [Thermoleophilaceae bacterium]